jgi:hypothetical protein
MELVFVAAVLLAAYGAAWFWKAAFGLLKLVVTVVGMAVRWLSKAAFGLLGGAEEAGAGPPGGRAARRPLGAQDLGRLREAFRAFAERRGGDLVDRPLFEPPRVAFVHGAARAVLSLYEAPGGGAHTHTQIAFTVPQGWERRLEIFPESSRPDEPWVARDRDARLGDPAFDARWAVRADDAAFAREFLDGRTRQALEALRALGAGGHALVSLTPSRLLVRKAGALEPAADLHAFADLAGLVHDRVFFFWQRLSGIEILEESPPERPADPVCRVCGAAIAPEARVTCRRCRTPHHRDCWEFNGQCSTYACGERRWVPAGGSHESV